MDFIRHLTEMVEASKKLQADDDRRVCERGAELLQAAKSLVALYAQIMANGNAKSWEIARSVLTDIVNS